MGIETGESKLWIINFYREQLSKLRKIGLGRKTENDVLITERLMQITENRLANLVIGYENSICTSTLYQRKFKAQLRGQMNGSSNTIRTIAKTRKQSNGNT